MDTNITTMKVLLINGSPHREGNTFIALSEVARTLEAQGIGRRSSTSGRGPCRVVSPAGNVRNWGIASFPMPCIPPCGRSLPRPTALWSARRSIMPAERFALRAARPRVLFVRPRSGLQACRCRGCLPPWRGERDVRPPEQVFYDFEYARRAVAVLEQRTRTGAGEAREDAEGLQTMRVLARNMAQLLKAGVGPRLAPEPEERVWTHFIR